MARAKTGLTETVFWGSMGAIFVLGFGSLIGYVYGEFLGAGAISGGATAIFIFLVAGFILTKNAGSLPRPNTVKAPVAPPGGAFQAPLGGKFRAPDAPPPSAAPARRAAPPAPEPSLAEISHSAGEAVGKAAYTASAAVTSAAQAAKEAIASVIGQDTDGEQEKGSTAEPTRRASAGPVAAAPTAAAGAAAVQATRPVGLDGPRGGAPDDLKRLSGVGPRLEGALNGIGVYHFDQIAGWSAAEVAWVDAFVEGVNGRATRDDWVGNARLMAGEGPSAPLEGTPDRTI